MAMRNHFSLPVNATEVNVHKIIDPYTILISDVKNFSENIDRINEDLRIIAKRIDKSKRYKEKEKPELSVGTLTVIRQQTPDGIDLPAWCCRAIITSYNQSNSKYTAFLLDYGGIFELCREAFTPIPPNIISDPPLTEAITLYNILPAKKHKNTKTKSLELIIEPEWPRESIDLTKNLLAASQKYYFDLQTIGDDEKKYGELYLVIDNQVISLTKALVHSYVAVYCSPDLLDFDAAINQNAAKKSNSFVDRPLEEILKDPKNTQKLIAKSKRSCCDDIFISSELDCSPLENITAAKFPGEIHEALQNFSVKNLWKLQSYMWPAIMKSYDILAVGPAKHGKTFGYIVPIASIIVKTRNYQVEDHPMALVLCVSSVDVIETHTIFRELLQSYAKEIKIIAAFNGCTDRSITAQIFNGCHIFISTPAFLMRYLSVKEHRDILKFSHISHLIIDNLDIMMNKHFNTIMEFLGKFTLFSKNYQQKLNNMMALQVVATSRTWSVDIGKFIQAFNNPYVCIRSFADAAIFCGIKLRTRLVPRDQKNKKIEEILGDHYKLVKTMIVCASNDEAEDLNNYLDEKLDILSVNKQMLFTEILGIKELWNAGVSGLYKLLICTDDVLSTLDITDVDWLIHYSVSVPSKSAFLFRFSTLMNNLKIKSTKTEVTIFIDDSNDVQLRGILDLVLRSGYKFSSKQLDHFERIYVNIERRKTGFAICNSINEIGQCPLLGSCTYRHCVIAESDSPMTRVAIGDRVKLLITYIHSATHFSARITEFIDSDGEKFKLPEEDHANIVSKVLYYYANRENRRRVRVINPGGIYGYDKSFDQYERVQVINIIKYDDSHNPTVVDLRAIDSGLVYTHEKVTKLVEIPEELAKAPAHIVEVFLANIQPYDKEHEWNIRAIECTEQWLKTELRAGTFLQGKVQLHLGNTLWVDPLEIRMKIVHRREMVNSSLKHHLIKQKHGIANDFHIPMLKKLCSNAGMAFFDDSDSTST